jgi:hypothetical protein
VSGENLFRHGHAGHFALLKNVREIEYSRQNGLILLKVRRTTNPRPF